MVLYCDNKAAIEIANNPVLTVELSIELDRNFIKDNLDSGMIQFVILRVQINLLIWYSGCW